MINKRIAISVVVVILATLMLGCGSDSKLLTDESRSTLSAPVLKELGGKSTSGVPIGIFLAWNRETDPSAVGYYIYRDTESIPDPPAESDIDPALRVNDGAMLDNPSDGETVVFNDIFDVEIGTEYFYRVTVVDSQVPAQESPPSNELSWIAHGHNISGISPSSAYWGDDITISGDTFGDSNQDVDRVLFERIGGSVVEGEVQSWEATEIVVTVPINADTGLVSVVIDGTIAQSDDPLTILNPLIDTIDPNPGFVQQPLTLTGRNFNPIDPSTMQLFIADEDVTAYVTSWTDTEVILDVPEESDGGDLYLVVNDNDSNRIVFSTRAELLSAYPFTVQSGELLTLSGRFLGLPGKVYLNGTEELVVDSWSSVDVVVQVVGEPGSVTFTLETFSGVTSNVFDYEICQDLAVTLSGIDPVVIYTTDIPPTLGVETSADADRVEILVDGIPTSESTTVPFNDLVLPVSLMTNGTHEISLRAHRRTITQDSNIMSATVYSLVGDVDGNGVVGDSDTQMLDLMLGLEVGDLAFFPWYDTNDDGIVNELDLALVGYNYGNMITP